MRRWVVAFAIAGAVFVPLAGVPPRGHFNAPLRESPALVEGTRVEIEISIAPDPVPVDRLDLARQLFDLINDARTERGLTPLGWWTAAVHPAADAQTDRMVAAGKIFHNPKLDPLLYTLRAQTIAENVGMGPSIAALHRAFMKSKGHRENILEPDFNLGAVWIVRDVDGVLFVTEIFGRPVRRR